MISLDRVKLSTSFVYRFDSSSFLVFRIEIAISALQDGLDVLHGVVVLQGSQCTLLEARVEEVQERGVSLENVFSSFLRLLLATFPLIL